VWVCGDGCHGDNEQVVKTCFNKIKTSSHNVLAMHTAVEPYGQIKRLATFIYLLYILYVCLVHFESMQC
jgi:hypothetical protein